MLFIINAEGTVQTTFPSQVYQGSNEASDIILLASWTAGAAVTVSYTLPTGAWTDPYLLTPQGDVELDGVSYTAWRAAIPAAITQYSGAVTAQFSVTNGTQTVTSAAAQFTVQAGAGVELPDNPEPGIYEEIKNALGDVYTKYTDVDGKVEDLYGDLATEVAARESADATLGARVAGVEGGLAAETAARESADTALDGRLGDVEAGLDKKVDKVQAGTYYSVYGVQPTNSGGAQTIINASDRLLTGAATILMRDAEGRFQVKDPVLGSEPVNLRTQTAAIDAAKAEAKAYTDTRFSQFDLVVVVRELPATGEENKLYLLTKENGEAGDLFEEYVWVNGAWERQGAASIDLSGYATTEALTEGLAGKLDKSEGWDSLHSVYGVDPSGNQTMYVVSSNAINNSIAWRDASGAVVVGTATDNAHAVNLGQMESYVADNAISLTMTGTIEPVAGSRVMTLGSNGNVILIEGNPSSYMLIGVKSNGDPVMYKPNNYSAESQTVAVRGSYGVLAVGTPTADTHATTKKYVDEKCVTYTISTDTGYWYDAPVSGPPGEQDARAVLLSDIGVNITGAKGFIWTLHNEGAEGESGCSALVPCTPIYNGGKVQIDTEELYIVGSQTDYRFLNLIVFY